MKTIYFSQNDNIDNECSLYLSNNNPSKIDASYTTVLKSLGYLDDIKYIFNENYINKYTNYCSTHNTEPGCDLDINEYKNDRR